MSSVESAQATTFPETSKPRRRTRRTIFGGFVITDEEAYKWANRLRAEKGKPVIKLSRKQEPTCLVTLEERVTEAGGIQVNFHGQRRPENGGACDKFIVITQIGVDVFEYGEDGRPVMDPKKKLVPGPFEERAKELFKQEGVKHAEFDTIFA